MTGKTERGPPSRSPLWRAKEGRRHASSADDERLWHAIAKQVSPLPRAPKPASKPAPPPAPKPARQNPAKSSASSPKTSPAPLAPRQPPAAAQASLVDLDRRTADRFRRGEMAIEARLDLHGLTRAEAQAALDRFLARAFAAGRRCLLVITGTGARRAGPDDSIMMEPRGVLKDLVPRWLAEPMNRARVTAFHAAKPKHGGAGALYVLLRRQRAP